MPYKFRNHPNGARYVQVSRQAATGPTGSDNLKVETFGKATQYCTSQSKSMELVSTNEAAPCILGNYPKAEVRFMCVGKGDSARTGTQMQKMPDPMFGTQKSSN
jgi:hypothetical protein